ncbi:hypothetical protein [uncultured Microbacterium sp.]|uniref:hypothetical protein n=1 Tax=uncultured Microbacterium sp. TaxID=191216 RepID=UPI0028D59481|nr:hypothetical protein [uncultured Microbacterium sp.]
MNDDDTPSAPRQKVVRVTGSRRARLTPVEGTDTSPERAAGEKPPASAPRDKGPNDDRLMQDVPPHY